MESASAIVHCPDGSTRIKELVQGMTARDVIKAVNLPPHFHLRNEDNEQIHPDYFVTIRPRSFSICVEVAGGAQPVRYPGCDERREEPFGSKRCNGLVIIPGFNIVFACLAAGCERQFVMNYKMNVHNLNEIMFIAKCPHCKATRKKLKVLETAFMQTKWRIVGEMPGRNKCFRKEGVTESSQNYTSFFGEDVEWGFLAITTVKLSEDFPELLGSDSDYEAD